MQEKIKALVLGLVVVVSAFYIFPMNTGNSGSSLPLRQINEERAVSFISAAVSSPGSLFDKQD